MNKLKPEHLHLLLDEPIYVLEEHFEGHEQSVDLEPETEQLPKFKGENKKGILIIIEEKAEDSSLKSGQHLSKESIKPNIQINIDPTLDPEKLEKQLIILKRFGLI